MTRDYSKKPRAGGGAKPNRGDGGQLPGWLWMVAGLAVGLFVAFLVYLNQVAPESQTAQRPAVPAPAPAPAAKPEPAKKSAAKPEPAKEKGGISYDFYKILPEYEVVIPEEELEKPKPLDQRPGGGRFFIQAGSFRNASDADTRKAELAMLGLVSEIQKVSIDGPDKSTWHRVRVGPFVQQRDLDKARRLLQDNGIGFITVKEPT